MIKILLMYLGMVWVFEILCNQIIDAFTWNMVHHFHIYLPVVFVGEVAKLTASRNNKYVKRYLETA